MRADSLSRICQWPPAGLAYACTVTAPGRFVAAALRCRPGGSGQVAIDAIGRCGAWRGCDRGDCAEGGFRRRQPVEPAASSHRTPAQPMATLLLIVHLVVTLALIGVVLLQRSEGGGLGVGSSQGMGGFMTGRGTANLLTRTTAVLGTAFFALSLTLA